MTRHRRRGTALGLALALVAAAGVGYARMARQTPLSTSEAVDRFEAELEKQGAADEGRSATPAAPGAGAPADAGSVPATAPSPTATAPAPVAARLEAPRAVAPGTAAARADQPRRPPQGLYDYVTEGEEGIGVFSREFPPRSFRSIIHQADGGWSDHHRFSDERESWSSFSIGTDRRLVHSQRNKVVIGPVTKDVTITFRPPLASTLLPWRTGRSWGGPLRGTASGSDNGEVTGTVRGQTRGVTSLRIGGMTVSTWIDRLHLELHGAVEGTVDVTRWLAPASGLTVREEYHADVELGGGVTYRAQWSIQLRSLQPVR